MPICHLCQQPTAPQRLWLLHGTGHGANGHANRIGLCHECWEGWLRWEGEADTKAFDAGQMRKAWAQTLGRYREG